MAGEPAEEPLDEELFDPESPEPLVDPEPFVDPESLFDPESLLDSDFDSPEATVLPDAARLSVR